MYIDILTMVYMVYKPTYRLTGVTNHLVRPSNTKILYENPGHSIEKSSEVSRWIHKARIQTMVNNGDINGLAMVISLVKMVISMG